MLQRQLAEIEKIATATASTVSVATKTLISIAGLLLAFYAILATFAPGSLGVVLAKTLESAGYEIQQKQPGAVSSASVDSRRPVDKAVVVEVPPNASGKASEGALGKKP